MSTIESGRVHVYMDDLLIISMEHQANVNQIDKILKRFTKFKLKIKLNKCQFLREEIEFLGHNIDKNGITPVSNNIIKINSFPTPTCVKQLQSFLGLCNYYRWFIRDIARKASPLYELLKVNQRFNWNQEAEKAFLQLKKELMGETRLFHPDPELPFILSTDASKHSIAAVLSQKNRRGIEKPLLFLSKKL